MRAQSIVLPLLVGCSTLLWGCGKDSSGPVTPKAIAIVSGDNQTGPGGDDLPDSLRVVVTGSDKRPMAGVTVTWAAGGADVSPPTSTTDANGATAVQLSLGPVGAVIVTATVAGLAPATFNETAVDPCTWRHPLSIGETVIGLLHSYDCLDRVWFIDYYLLPVSGLQRTLVVTTASDVLLTSLLVWNGAGHVVAFDDYDESTSYRNARVKIVAAGGEYVIGAISTLSGASGPYALAAAETPSSEENCEDFWLTRGVTTQQVLSTTDCAEAGSTYGDEFLIDLHPGETLDVTETTTAFDALIQLYRIRTSDYYLRLRSSSATLVASDDSVGGTHLTFTADSTTYYVLVATTMTPGRQGAYTLTLAPPVGGAAALNGPRLLVHPSLPSQWPGRRLRR
ncbi:MAG TPA: Ig-like domain-containing protein [Gemmatimonadales bacterium]|jgi:hypothetical protein|nr:Ig-like domain-containing protein [Gemmatimonadales bacterium]